MRNIDYARVPDHIIANLLKYEITSTSFYLTKDDSLCKHKNSELTTEVKKPFKKECLFEVLMCNKKATLVVYFMAYARNLQMGKAKLKTYRDMVKHLWNTFTKLASDYERIDITFDLCIIYGIKDTKCNRRNAVEGVSTNIFGSEQQLPINTKIFSPVGENKMKFQQFFIDWLTKNYSGSISLYPGGSHHGEIISCFRLSDGILTQDHFLK